MEYYEVKEWLDGIVDTIRKQHQHEVLSSSIKTHHVEDKYLMVSGLNIISDVMRIPLTCKDIKRDDSIFKHRYSLVYRGIEFIQLEETPLEGGFYANV